MSDTTIARHPMLHFTPEGDRYFLVPPGQELAPGKVTIVSVTGDKLRVDSSAIAPFEVSRDEAQAHLAAQAQQALAGAADTVGRALGLAGVGEAMPDLRAIAARLGVPEPELRADPQAARSAIEGLAGDLHAVASAVAAGAPADLDAARAALAARGIDVGHALDELPGYLAAIRRLDQKSAATGAASGLRALADAIEGQDESLGRRIDELIARLDRELGPFMGRDPERERRERQAGYARSARASIAESLRAHGITPLATDEPDTPDEPPRRAG
jgi:hypothetical protein